MIPGYLGGSNIRVLKGGRGRQKERIRGGVIREAKVGDAMFIALKMEEIRSWVKMRVASKSYKTQGLCFLLEPPGRNTALPRLWLAQEDLCQTFDLQSWRKISATWSAPVGRLINACQHRTSKWSTLRSLIRPNLGKFLTQHLQGIQ